MTTMVYDLVDIGFLFSMKLRQRSKPPSFAMILEAESLQP